MEIEDLSRDQAISLLKNIRDKACFGSAYISHMISNTMTREEFSELDPSERTDKINSGVFLVENENRIIYKGVQESGE